MKLIRDKIPMIMNQQGVSFDARIADNDEYKQLIVEKMHEEVEELMTDKNIEEAADVYEVFVSLVKLWGHELHEVIEYADMKRENLGGFDERVILLKSETYRPRPSKSKQVSKLFGKPN